MFGPVRGPGVDDDRTGWWGETIRTTTPCPCSPRTLVRRSLSRAGQTSSPGHRGREAAGGNDVRIVGGAATMQRYLRAGLIDDLHVVVVLSSSGAGERSRTSATTRRRPVRRVRGLAGRRPRPG